MIDAVRAVRPEGVDAIADTAMLHEDALPSLRRGGILVSVRGWTGDESGEHRFAAASVSRERHFQGKLETLREFVQTGALTPRLLEAVPVEQVADAHRRLEQGGTRGRIVLTF